MTKKQAVAAVKKMAKAGRIFATISIPGYKRIALAGTAKRMAVIN
jgi:hypothetical protein